MSELSRRVFLGTASLAAGAAGVGAANDAAAEKQQTHEGRKESSEELPTFRFAMEQNKGHVTDGGSARQATIKELPVSKGLAGVSMRLNPGGIRELHWHAIAAEWAFVIKGRVRTTVIGPDGTSETNDFDPGDVWYFPRGHGHMLQGLGPGETHFVLIFDDGAFSEFGTFSTTDWLGHTPPRGPFEGARPSGFRVCKVPQGPGLSIRGLGRRTVLLPLGAGTGFRRATGTATWASAWREASPTAEPSFKAGAGLRRPGRLAAEPRGRSPTGGAGASPAGIERGMFFESKTGRERARKRCLTGYLSSQYATGVKRLPS